MRLINLPTGAEGDDLVGFLCKMLPQCRGGEGCSGDFSAWD